jgi:hypothetical protein
MKLSQQVNGANVGIGDEGLNFNSFRSSSPYGMLPGKDFFKDSSALNFGSFGQHEAKNGLDLFFEKQDSHEQLSFGDDFEGSEKVDFTPNHDSDEEILNFKIDLEKNDFKKPSPMDRKESDSVKDSETNAHTKDVYHSGVKRATSCRTDSVVDTKCDTQSVHQKKFYHDELSMFGDLFSPKETSLPGLNNLVSLSIASESGTLSVTCKNSKNKLLHNFLSLAEESDLLELQQAIKDCEAELSSEMRKLGEQKNFVH